MNNNIASYIFLDYSNVKFEVVIYTNAWVGRSWLILIRIVQLIDDDELFCIIKFIFLTTVQCHVISSH